MFFSSRLSFGGNFQEHLDGAAAFVLGRANGGAHTHGERFDHQGCLIIQLVRHAIDPCLVNGEAVTPATYNILDELLP